MAAFGDQDPVQRPQVAPFLIIHVVLDRTFRGFVHGQGAILQLLAVEQPFDPIRTCLRCLLHCCIANHLPLHPLHTKGDVVVEGIQSFIRNEILHELDPELLS